MLINAYIEEYIFLAKLSSKIPGVGISLKEFDCMANVRNRICIRQRGGDIELIERVLLV